MVFSLQVGATYDQEIEREGEREHEQSYIFTCISPPLLSHRETCVSDVQTISINITKETKAQHMLANALSCKSCTPETCSVNTRSHKTVPRLLVAFLLKSYFNVRFPTKGQVHDSFANTHKKTQYFGTKESKREPSANSHYSTVKKVVQCGQEEVSVVSFIVNFIR